MAKTTTPIKSIIDANVATLAMIPSFPGVDRST